MNFYVKIVKVKEIITWNCFISLATRFLISDDLIEIVLDFLRNLNILHHFRDYSFKSKETEEKAKSFVVLKPEM